MKDYMMEPLEQSMPVCPICEEECEELYFDNNGDICGCDNCITVKNAYEYEEEKAEIAAEIARDAYEDLLYELYRDRKYEKGE